MGAKFCNLNLRGTGLVLPEIAGAKTFENGGWTTVTSPRFQWGSTQPYAQRLSAELGAAVLCTEYFDDDYAELSLYEKGKRVARHVPATYEDLRRAKGRAEKFLAVLGLDPMEKPLLERIFEEKDPERCVCLAESLFGCPMWGVDEDCPPAGAPDPNVARSYADGTCPVRAAAEKRRMRADRPPYRDFEIGTPPRPEGELLREKEIFEYDGTSAGRALLFREDTVFCCGGELKQILRSVRRRRNILVEMIEEKRARLGLQARFSEQSRYDREEARLRELEQTNFRVFQRGELLVLKGVLFCNLDVDLPDLAHELRCLTAACRVEAGKYREESHYEVCCGIAYGKKLLCYGRRGAESGVNTVMPDLTLESPWLTLGPGELVRAFETPAYWDAVEALGELLGFSLWQSEPGPEWERTLEEPHLQVFRKMI